MRKAAVSLLAALVPVVAAVAQNAPGAKATPKPDMLEGAAAFAVRPPDEGSPFFAERQAAVVALSKETVVQTPPQDANVQVVNPQMVAIYPRTKNTPDSASAMFTKFFTEMFSSIKFHTVHYEPTTEKLQIEPKNVSLNKNKELETTYTVTNNTGKLIRLDFNTTQRIDLVTTDASGKVVDRWSDDRASTPQDGIIILNPKERIEYNEKIPTREMKSGESYTIQSEMVGYPDYTVSKTIIPSP